MSQQTFGLGKAGIMSMIFGSMAVSATASEPSDRPARKNQEKPMNVLFFMSDDMRTDWGVYGTPQMRTPNFDRLASQGVLFQNAYCQFTLSGPSRTALLSGHRPTVSGIYNNSPWFGADHPEWQSLTMYFKNHGYTTYGSGKTFHNGVDDTDSWTYGGQRRLRNNGTNEKPGYVSMEEHRNFVEMLKESDLRRAQTDDRWEAVEGEAAKTLEDTQIADKAIEYIKEAAKKNEPFFIGCGFHKPHSPFVAPKEFFDLYDVNDIPLPEDFASLPMVPIGFPAGSIRENTADFFVSRSASPEEAKEFIKAYWACISYVDWNVGRVVEALEEAGLKDNTIIVFCVDHGFQLGEKGKWSKAGSLWEEGCNVPLLVIDPRAKGNGQISHRIVENQDIYPTLVELCGLPANTTIDGESFAPLLNDPDMEWDNIAYTVWDNHGKGVTGVVLRTEKWRYAEYYGIGAGAFLTDPINDPKELANLVNQPEYADVVAKMHALAQEYVKGQRELTAEEAGIK